MELFHNLAIGFQVALSFQNIFYCLMGCLLATLIGVLFAPPLAEVALKFGPAEYFSLMVLGLIAATVLAHGSLIKAIAMVILGLLLGLVGTDVNSGVARFSFGVSELSDGIGFVSVAMGVFGFAEIIANLEQKEQREVFTKKVSNLLPCLQDLKDSWASILRGTALGSFLGILPGGGALLASFAAYTLEKKVSKNSANFGKGAIQGVAAPESANNAGAQTSFIPLLTLGIPSNPVMALMIGAMMIQGIAPGPQLMEENLRRAMLLSRGDPLVFFQRPISLTMLVIAGLLLTIVVAPTVRKKREEAFVEA